MTSSPVVRPQNLAINARLHLSRNASAPFLEPRGAQAYSPALPISGSLPLLKTNHGDLLPPPVIGSDHSSSRNSSRPSSPDSRPMTPAYAGSTDNLSLPSTPMIRVQNALPDTPESIASAEKDDKKSRRKSWFGRSKSKDREVRGPPAWIVGHRERNPYDVSVLTNAEPLPELWDPTGDCLVYLHPQTSGKGASFRVDSSVFASSPLLTRRAFVDVHSDSVLGNSEKRLPSLEFSTQDLSLQTPPATPQMENVRNFSTPSAISSRIGAASCDSSVDTARELHLYLPIEYKSSSGRLSPTMDAKATPEDTDQLVAVRNLFAFLTGQSLVATERSSSIFSLFLRLSDLLRLYEFSNLDGSTFGEVATASFDSYVEELGLADVRKSREKTVEGIVLGERMRSVALYNEAFTHAVGKHDELVKLNSAKFGMLSPLTTNRLGRAAMDLEKRQASVQHTLEDFDFPSIFSGIMNSKTADEAKYVDFDAWRDAFFSTRKFVTSFYKHRYGSWPPRASSKKNQLETSGLNRIVLRDLYHDFSSMYDLLVDRSNLTNRTADGILLDDRDIDAPLVRAMRQVLSEYDRSSPPVKPPIPFDLPMLPNLKLTRPDFETGDTKNDVKAMSKKLKGDEIVKLLHATHNEDAKTTPFLDAFKEMERKTSHSCTILEMVDRRMGQWMFMYAVIQALPLLVIDAPGIKHHEGVEYFLCGPPRSGVPWANGDALYRKNWYGIAGGGVVSLPSDVIEHSTDGVFRRSHCWKMAKQWSEGNPILASAVHEQSQGDEYTTQPPRLRVGRLRPDSRGSSPARSARESVLGLGLEALPLPAGVHPDGSFTAIPRARLQLSASRPVSMTFDDILAGTAQANVRRHK